MKRRLLIVEDDPDVLDILSNTFRKSGEFEIVTASDGMEGMRLARDQTPDALILDLMLPGMTGLEVCRILKSDVTTRGLPILILTAKADEFDRINGFELGADDYITKPFSPREVLLRVKAVMRRSQAMPPVETDLKAGPITLDRSRHFVALDGKPLRLTTTEFKLLAALMESRGRVLGRTRLLNEVWGYESPFNTRTVDTHIRRLRDKLGKVSAQIQTIRGFGYRMEDKER
jgi:two-component system phosphate regulon response regulator PhoB